jgi:hypothetical protein
MRTLFWCSIVLIGLEAAAGAQVPAPADSLYVTGEAASSRSVSGGGGGVDWVHPLSAGSMVTAGAASMRIGDESWTYGTLGGFTRRHDTWLSGSVGFGGGRRGPDSFPYLRFTGAATIPIARTITAETEGQFVRLNGTGISVVKVGALYGGLRHTSLRAAYVGASSSIQYWQYLFTRGDVSVGRVGVLAGLTTGRGSTHLAALGPDLLLHTSQEIFFGGSAVAGGTRTTCVAQVVQQASSRLARLTVTLQLPLGSRSGVTSGISK